MKEQEMRRRIAGYGQDKTRNNWNKYLIFADNALL